MKEKIIINSFSDECREMKYRAFLASSIAENLMDIVLKMLQILLQLLMHFYIVKKMILIYQFIVIIWLQLSGLKRKSIILNFIKQRKIK